MENLSKEKQIEEMAKSICRTPNCKMIVCADLKETTQQPCDKRCRAYIYANRFYNAGYRKANEVAGEIFADIWRTFDTSIWAHEIEIKSSKALGLADAQKFADRKKAIEDMKDYLRIVEKKYTEDAE